MADKKTNEIHVHVTVDDLLKEYLKEDTKTGSYSVIDLDSEESPDLEIFYKGRKVFNVVSVTLCGCGFKFDNETHVTNWRKFMEE